MAGLDEVFGEGLWFSKADAGGSSPAWRIHRRYVRPGAARDKRAGHGRDGQDQCEVGKGDAAPWWGSGNAGLGYETGAQEFKLYNSAG